MEFEIIKGYFLDLLFSFVVAVGWGILFGTPKKVLLLAGLMGGLGHSIRYLMIYSFGLPLVSATLCGTVFIGLCGIFVARKADTTPVVFTMPACITMIPGMYAYHAMLGLLKMVNTDPSVQHSDLIAETLHNIVLSVSLLFSLSIGITIGSLLFRKKTAREIKLNFKVLRKKNKS